MIYGDGVLGAARLGCIGPYADMLGIIHSAAFIPMHFLPSHKFHSILRLSRELMKLDSSRCNMLALFICLFTLHLFVLKSPFTLGQQSINNRSPKSHLFEQSIKENENFLPAFLGCEDV